MSRAQARREEITIIEDPGGSKIRVCEELWPGFTELLIMTRRGLNGWLSFIRVHPNLQEGVAEFIRAQIVVAKTAAEQGEAIPYPEIIFDFARAPRHLRNLRFSTSPGDPGDPEAPRYITFSGKEFHDPNSLLELANIIDTWEPSRNTL